jgi:hypothetical protein
MIKRHFMRGWICAVLVLPGIANAQTADDFAEIFVHPRDRHYLPGNAPSLPEVATRNFLDGDRGEVTRWEYQTDKRVINRELWTDENGETRGRLRLGRRF